MENIAIARLLENTADLLEVAGANPFRVRAYRNAGRVVRDIGWPIKDRVAEAPETLTELPTIGKDLAASIVRMVETGDFIVLAALARTGQDQSSLPERYDGVVVGNGAWRRAR